MPRDQIDLIAQSVFTARYCRHVKTCDWLDR